MVTRYATGNWRIAQQSDDELVELARRTADDEGAFEELYRRHEAAARNIARHILRSRQDADDVVNEAFAGVIAAIRNGAGPRSNFRQYLMACIRNSCKARRWSGTSVSTDPAVIERSGPAYEDPDRMSEEGLVASAFSSLSPDWQLTLWLTAVEERPAAEVAARLGRRPNAVAALAHRAREAFAEAYLAQHQLRTSSPACAKVSAKLPHYVRGNCGDVDIVLVERHLVECVPCSRAVDELRDLNASLRTLVGPAPLLGAGAGAATVAGLGSLTAAFGGWSTGSVAGGSLLKAAVIGVLLIPAAAVVSSDGAGGERHVARAQQADASGAVARASIVGPSASVAPDATEAAVLSAAPVVTGVGAGEVVTPAAVVAAAGVITDSIPVPVSVPEVRTPMSLPPVSATLPSGGGAGVSVAGDASGAVIGVGATVPLVTSAVSATIGVPGGSSGVGTPQISTAPIVLPDLGLTPPLTVPGVVLPSVTLMPAPSTTTSTPTSTTLALPLPLPIPPLTTLSTLLPPLVIPSSFG
jgi:RNA polymerase sigma factor (sigma-70 family)